MTNGLTRLGIIYPAGGGDQEYYQFAEAVSEKLRIYIVSTPLFGEGEDHQLEMLLKTGEVSRLREAARKFKTLPIDVVSWACTSGSFVGGVEWARKQVEAIGQETGKPTSSTSLSFMDALKHLEVETVSIMATYPKAVADTFVKFITDFGFSVSHMTCLGIMGGWDASLISETEMKKHISEAAHDDAEAILIPDTAIPTLSLIDEIEQETGKVLLSANQVTLWNALRLSGADFSVDYFGKLFQNPT